MPRKNSLWNSKADFKSPFKSAKCALVIPQKGQCIPVSLRNRQPIHNEYANITAKHKTCIAIFFRFKTVA